MQIVDFGDAGASRASPITVGPLAYNITCGSFRLVDWLTRFAAEWQAELSGVVRSHLVEIQTIDFPQFHAPRPNGDGLTLLVNARLVPSLENMSRLRDF